MTLPRRGVLGLVATLSLGCAVRGARAQDAYYWSETYGTYATLLGGVVVGRVPDISASFYNPGRLAFATGPAISLTTKVYQLSRLNIDINNTSYGSGEDLGSTSVRPSPAFAAGVLPVGDSNKTVLAYSYLSRQSDDQRLNTTFQRPSSGPTPDNAEIFLQRQASESWYGLSYSRRLNRRTGLGATLFGAYRSQFQRAEFSRQAPGTPPGAGEVVRQFDYYDFRLVVKAGFSSDFGPWSVGAVVTTPGLHILGSGRILESQTITDTVPPISSFSDQDGLPASYKSSWAFAFGVARNIDNVTIHATGEWFSPVDKYSVMDGAPIVPDDGRPPYDPDVIYQRQSVFNGGISAQVRRTATQSFYMFVKSDRSARPKNTGVDVTLSRWGRFHVGGGYSFRLGQWDLVAGLAYMRGSDEYTAGESDNPPGGLEVPPGVTAKVTDSRLRFLFGFNVRL